MESIQADFRAETPGLMEEPSWLPAYPGLDLSQVRDLTINITPSNWPYYWARARSACVFSSNKRLLPSLPLKMFRIVLADTVGILGWDLLTQWNYSDLRYSPRLATLEDLEKVIQIFVEVASLARQCELYLPRWIECDTEKERIFEEWEGRLKAKVF